MFSVLAVNAPLKAIVPAVLVSDTVAASTVLLKVVPPELVSVSVPMSVPTAPVTLTAAVVFSVRFDAVPPAVPLTLPSVSGVAAPVPTVRVLLSARVALPSVIWPVEAPPTVASSVTLTAVVPRLMTAVPAALMVPAMFFDDGAVAVTPPVNARLSAAASPSVSVPVLRKLTALVIVPPALRATA